MLAMKDPNGNYAFKKIVVSIQFPIFPFYKHDLHAQISFECFLICPQGIPVIILKE